MVTGDAGKLTVVERRPQRRDAGVAPYFEIDPEPQAKFPVYAQVAASVKYPCEVFRRFVSATPRS